MQYDATFFSVDGEFITPTIGWSKKSLLSISYYSILSNDFYFSVTTYRSWTERGIEPRDHLVFLLQKSCIKEERCQEKLVHNV